MSKINRLLWKGVGTALLMVCIALCVRSTIVAQTNDPIMTFGVAGTIGDVATSYPPVLDVVPANAAVSGYVWNTFKTDNPHNIVRSCLAYRERVETGENGTVFSEHYTFGNDHLCYDSFSGQLAILKNDSECTTGQACLETDGATAETRFKQMISANPEIVWIVGSKPDALISGSLVDAITVRDDAGSERTELVGGAAAYAEFYAYMYELVESGLQEASSTNTPKLAFCNTQIGGLVDDSFSGLDYCRTAYDQLQGVLDSRSLGVTAAESIHVLAASQLMFRETSYTKTVDVDGSTVTLTGGALLDEAVLEAAVAQHWSKYLRAFECWTNVMSSCTENALQSIANPDLVGIPLWLTVFGAEDGWCHEVHDASTPLEDGGTHCTETGEGHPFVGRHDNEGVWGMMRHQVEYLVQSELWDRAWWTVSHSGEFVAETTECTHSGTVWHFEDSAGNRRCSDVALWANPTEWTPVATSLGTHYNNVIDCALNDNGCPEPPDPSTTPTDPCSTSRSAVKVRSRWSSAPLFLPMVTMKGGPGSLNSTVVTVVTPMPTAVSTVASTTDPTVEATIASTGDPTSEPTIAPTVDPTGEPTAISAMPFVEDYLPPIKQSSIQLLGGQQRSRNSVVNAVFMIEFSDEFEVEEIYELFVEENGLPTILRDDGCGADEVDGDGIYTAEVELTPEEIALVQSGPDPLSRSNSSSSISIDEELMITDLDVINDSIRTFDPCGTGGTPTGNSNGVWGFKSLMMNIAGTTDEAVAAEFTLDWLRTWTTNQTVPNNIDTALARGTINSTVLTNWPEENDHLDLDLAPFRLLAIVPRLDLRETPTTAANGSAGEFRFVWGVLNPATCAVHQFTVIFEYGIPADNLTEIKQWADDIHSLNGLPGSEYNQRLEELSTRITNLNADPSKPNGSAINQIRTNEISLGFPWELREFVLDSASTATNKPLILTTVKQNPRDNLSGSSQLNTFITNNVFELTWENPLTGREAPFHEVPDDMLGIKTRSNNIIWGSTMSTSDSDLLEARHQLALNTCSGCHETETNTRFLMIEPRGSNQETELAGFLKGITNVTDPMDSSKQRDFNDLERRQEDLALMLNSTRYELGTFNGLIAREH